MSLSDFHVHSTNSDGKHTIDEIIDIATERGLKNLALTDHDSINGVAEFLIKAKDFGIKPIAGVELTTEYRDHRLDIVGYNIDIDSPLLAKRLERLKLQRNNRNTRLINKLLELGFKLDLDKIRDEEASPGGFGTQKTSIMILENKDNHKLISNPTQLGLGKEYLMPGGKAYTPLTDFNAVDAIKLVHQCGGIAAIAHGAESVRSKELLETIIRELAEAGLDAVEVYSPKHMPADITLLSSLVSELGLITTFGSDFHGKDEMHADLGSLDVPNEEEITKAFLASINKNEVKN